VIVAVDCDPSNARTGRGLGFFKALRASRRSIRTSAERCAAFSSSDAIANETFGRARADLTMLKTETETGAYPFAGVPWFSTPFGRDGLITALLTLWADPSLARGVLRYLAAHQATEDDPGTDAEPGKILHETRAGELARIGAVPFHRYYGAIDSTPLFVMLAGAYHERTGDLDTIERIGPAIDRALGWMTAQGERNGDGLLTYARRRPDGLRNQGWKDSDDSIFHADGALASGPIALVEVQGYAFAAWRAAARLSAALGRTGEVDAREAAAERVREGIEAQFWDEARGFYALALDGDKRPCAVRASNAGHLLLAGAASPERAARVADTLLSSAFFNGYGVRTVASTEARYNPMSYHNGSIWPHDTALIACGLAKYGAKQHAVRLLDGMLEAARHMELRRLPELFCGFRRPLGVAPTLYPVACAPQAWAAAAPFGLLQAALGLSLDAASRTVRLDRPRLPARLEEVRLTNLRIGDDSVDLLLHRAGGDVAVDVLDRRGTIDVAVSL
jgi:glycogen debranching enzyme